MPNYNAGVLQKLCNWDRWRSMTLGLAACLPRTVLRNWLVCMKDPLILQDGFSEWGGTIRGQQKILPSPHTTYLHIYPTGRGARKANLSCEVNMAGGFISLHTLAK